ncbi:hypothetical protein PR048_011605 [Dryococelus australis]|uniref:Uncharacterized protein n=1 Tax=Dryococelus australis TaxID=614101 RepID=A0ABQ9HM30_9NEOP|nr:hypothetical protein PR048_011605 [Dryococelus australis]
MIVQHIVIPSTFISLFVEKESRPEISSRKPDLHWRIFTNEFNIKFEEETLGSKSLHLLKAEVFIKKKEILRKNTRTGDVCLSFDYMHNLPLHNLKTNAVLYSRQMWYNVFGVHDLGSDSVTMFTYHEGDGKNGGDKVTYMLLNYINNNKEPLNVLVLISDGCCGQTKNLTMVQLLFVLVHCFRVFKTATYLLPVRGHSYIPKNEDFSLIEIKKQCTQCVELREGWSNIIQEARKKPFPYSVVNMHYYDFVNIKDATKHSFLRKPKPPYKLRSARECCKSLNTTNMLGYRDIPTELDLPLLDGAHASIAPAKKKDLQKLMLYVKPENRMIYEHLIHGIPAAKTPDSVNAVDPTPRMMFNPIQYTCTASEKRASRIYVRYDMRDCPELQVQLCKIVHYGQLGRQATTTYNLTVDIRKLQGWRGSWLCWPRVPVTRVRTADDSRFADGRWSFLGVFHNYTVPPLRA